jgi:lactoylglutathione lyase
MLRNVCLRVGVVAATVALGSVGAAQTDVAVRTIAYDNLHIGVTDRAKAAEWYVRHLGATPAPSPWRVYFGKTVLVFVTREKTLPSAGSVIDHLALSYSDAPGRLESLRAGGAKMVPADTDSLGSSTHGFFEDPWGVKIEILQDPQLSGFHHVHLRVPDPQASLTWYQNMFGGDRGRLKGLDGVRYGNVWLLAAASGGSKPAPSVDRAIQCVAWQIHNRDQAVAALAGKGVKTVSAGVSKVEGQEVPWAYVNDPDGVRIELLQRPH